MCKNTIFERYTFINAKKDGIVYEKINNKLILIQESNY
jgi:hypothetical protein